MKFKAFWKRIISRPQGKERHRRTLTTEETRDKSDYIKVEDFVLAISSGCRLIHEVCGFDPQSGHRQESTNECIKK